MKYVKRFILVLFSLILLVVAAIFILLTFYKKEMADMLVSHLKDHYALSLKVESVNTSLFSNWPNASVQFKQVSVVSDLDSLRHQPLLKAGTIALSFDLKRLFQKEFIVKSILIKDAEINLIRGEAGRNFDFKTTPSKDTTSSSAIKFEISRVTVKNTKFQFINEPRKQRIAMHFLDNDIKLKPLAEGTDAELTGDVNVEELLFKQKKGPFLKNALVSLHLKAHLYTTYKSVFIDQPSFVTINGQRYDVKTYIDLEENKRLILNIVGKGIDYKKSIGLLNTTIQKILFEVDVAKPFDVSALIVAKFDVKEDPILVVKMNAADNNVTIGNTKIPYSKVGFVGTIVSLDRSLQRGNTEEAVIYFRSVKGFVYDYPFIASVKIKNLEDPFIKINARLMIDATKVKFKPGQEFILKGNCTAQLSYAGPTNKLNNLEFLDPPMKLQAQLTFDNFSYKELKEPYVYTVNGKATLNNKDLIFDHLKFKMDGGNVSLNGRVDAFTKYALGIGNSFKAYITAETDNFDINPYLTGNEKRESEDLEEKNRKNQSKLEKSVQQAEDSNFEFYVTVKAKRLGIRKVEATQSTMELSYKDRLLAIKNLHMHTCDGQLFANGTIYDLTKINLNVELSKINVNELFDQFEGFGQKAIESKNLKGRISLNAKFQTQLDKKMDIIPATMLGEVKLKLEEGHLIDYEPLLNVSNFIFKNRDFTDVSFTELNETFTLKGYEMEIQELEIASNILNLFVSGNYNFKDYSNINLLVPWSNLKKRGKNYIPKESGQSAENTKGLKLNYSGVAKKMKLSLGHK